MDLASEILEYARFVTEPQACSYLPQQLAEMDYHIVAHVSAAKLEDLLSRGWRRFGNAIFRPVCRNCFQCRSLRIPVDSFQFSRNHTRVLNRNAHIRVVVQSPTVTDDHIRLYNAYHADMEQRRNWDQNIIGRDDYKQIFLTGDSGFAREFLYYDANRLVGVGLADVVPSALSSVYFFHDPEWRSDSPGTFSVLQQLKYCQRHQLRYQYLGYCVAACQSLAYKANYRPHEILERFPNEDELPTWLPAQTPALDS